MSVHLLTLAAAVVMPTGLRWPGAWPIRRHPHIAHFMPYLRGDSLRAIKLAKRLRFRYIDQNANEDANHVVWIMHWPKLWKNGYHWRWTGRYVTHRGRRVEERVRIAKADRDLLVHHATTLTVSRLRSRKYGGTRPYTAAQHMRHCAEHGMVLCLEGKGSLRHLDAFRQLAADAVATGCTVVFMRLQSIRGWRRALDYALQVGFPCAILPRAAKPSDWHQYAAAGVQVWGRWR